ncbi:MAG: chorismate synthase [Lachnospiraceae bacterium]
MAGSTYGTLFTITTWGESHGAGIGVVIDGCPAGLPLCEEDIQIFLNRRRPGQSPYSTKRTESDHVELLSGVFSGITTGAPISLLVRNQNARSEDYQSIQSCYRPGHADYPLDKKYGIRDYRGGGRSSGRETIGRVAAGAIASKLLAALGIRITTYTKSIGSVMVPANEYDYAVILSNPLCMPNLTYAESAEKLVSDCMERRDSLGGIIECVVTGMPVGIGSPVFEKLDANLAKAVMSIGSVKGFEMGDGFDVSLSSGSSNNDAFRIHNEQIIKASNHSGGTLGGLSDGASIVFRAAIKPTPSIAFEQETVTDRNQEITLTITGRHDPVIVPRAVVVVESMTALTLIDMLLINMGTKLDSLVKFYE